MTQTGWRRQAAVAMLTTLSLFGIWAATPASVTAPAGRFVHYYQTLRKTDRSVTFWERVIYSLLLANASKAGASTCRQGVTASS